MEKMQARTTGAARTSLPREREDPGGESQLNYTIGRIRLKGGRMRQCSGMSPEAAEAQAIV
jgi:hypothetical protein